MKAPTILLGLVLLTACPDRETRPGRDDTSSPAGDTGEECEAEQAKIKALEAELAECRAPKVDPERASVLQRKAAPR